MRMAIIFFNKLISGLQLNSKQLIDVCNYLRLKDSISLYLKKKFFRGRPSHRSAGFKLYSLKPAFNETSNRAIFTALSARTR